MVKLVQVRGVGNGSAGKWTGVRLDSHGERLPPRPLREKVVQRNQKTEWLLHVGNYLVLRKGGDGSWYGISKGYVVYESHECPGPTSAASHEYQGTAIRPPPTSRAQMPWGEGGASTRANNRPAPASKQSHLGLVDIKRCPLGKQCQEGHHTSSTQYMASMRSDWASILLTPQGAEGGTPRSAHRNSQPWWVTGGNVDHHTHHRLHNCNNGGYLIDIRIFHQKIKIIIIANWENSRYGCLFLIIYVIQ